MKQRKWLNENVHLPMKLLFMPIFNYTIYRGINNRTYTQYTRKRKTEKNSMNNTNLTTHKTISLLFEWHVLNIYFFVFTNKIKCIIEECLKRLRV